MHSGFLPELFQRPSPSSSQPNLVGQLLLHLNLYGNAYVAKYRDDTGRIVQLGLLHPDLVEPELVQGELRFVVTDAKTGRQSKRDSGDIVHVKAMSSDGLKGLSPIAQCRLAVSLSKGMGEYAEAFIRNGTRPSGILRLPTGTAEQMRNAEELITEKHAGAQNAHKVAIVSGGPAYRKHSPTIGGRL